ncbi:hypothetical protein H5410_042615 [Solanum commersonii]|uniref:Uncharacterized protein n=1 Tax=Solanum commersonii TaxID=4109 RepID=A0A9J5XW64_SOLCO|nr:hypothetical protein H5410_042615 [Solanum commersonii]
MMWKKLKVLGAGSYGTVSLATPLPQYYSGTAIYGAVKSAEVAFVFPPKKVIYFSLALEHRKMHTSPFP